MGEYRKRLYLPSSKKSDITKKFDIYYRTDWKKHQIAKVASSLQSSLATFVIYVSFKKLQENNAPLEELFKRINSLIKALDVSKEEWISKDSLLFNDIHNDLSLLLEQLPIQKIFKTKNIINTDFKIFKNKIIPITILYSEGPIARAYLETFKLMGLKPKKIIHMVSSIDVATKKPIGTILPSKLRIKYAAFSQDSKINFWPRNIERKFPELQEVIFNEINKKLNISIDKLKKTTKKINLKDYCENLETILVDGLQDKAIEEKLMQTKEGTILYTGGGIVPPSLLNINKTRFIHIHPGYLPDVKGADCTLWSSMLYKRASASCFYMSSGIDTGDIIMPRWMPELNLNINKDKYDDKTLYRAIFSYLDPWLRAVVLRELLSTYEEFENIECISQKEEDGYTYYFMQDVIKFETLNRLFLSKKRL
jgi:hypothetical protein